MPEAVKQSVVCDLVVCFIRMLVQSISDSPYQIKDDCTKDYRRNIMNNYFKRHAIILECKLF